MITNDSKWQWDVIVGKRPFFRVTEEPITKHSKEGSLNQRPCEVPWKGPVELRTDLAKQVPKKNDQQ